MSSRQGVTYSSWQKVPIDCIPSFGNQSSRGPRDRSHDTHCFIENRIEIYEICRISGIHIVERLESAPDFSPQLLHGGWISREEVVCGAQSRGRRFRSGNNEIRKLRGNIFCRVFLSSLGLGIKDQPDNIGPARRTFLSSGAKLVLPKSFP